MPAAKHTTLESSRTTEELFAALLQVVQNGEYELAGLSNETRQMLFKSGMTAISWGHHYVANVEASAGGSTLNLTITGIPRAPKSLMDGRKNKKAGEELIDAVHAVLVAGEPPLPKPVESFAVLGDGSTVSWTEKDYPGA